MRVPVLPSISCLHTGAVLLALGLGACKSYEARPLVPADELLALSQTASLEQLRIDHTRLGEGTSRAAAAFDVRDGLNEAELVAVALTVNPSLRSKRLEIGEAKALLVSAGVWPNPDLNLVWWPGLGGSSGTGFEWDLLFSLLRPDEQPAKQAVAEARLAAVRAELAAEEMRVAADVRRGRIAMLAAAKRMQFLEQESRLRDEALGLAYRLHDRGEGTAYTTSLLELDRAGIQRDLRDARADFEREQRSLNQTVGVPPHYNLPLSSDNRALAFSVYEDVADEEVDRRLLAGRFDLRALASAYELAEAELRLAVARQYPDMRVGPSWENRVEGDTSLGLGGSIELPIFDRNKGEIAAKQAARDRARAEYAALLHDLRARAFDARASQRRAKEEVEIQQRETAPLIDHTERLFEGAFVARELTVFEWIAARNRTVLARNELLDALVRYTTTTVEFETAIGTPLAIPVSEGAAGNARVQ